MLQNIDIKNIAVIKDLSFSPKDNMSVLTGETGAGKSIIIDCLNLVCGSRINKDMLRYGEDKATVCALFSADKPLIDYLLEQGIDIEDDQILIKREIHADGKSVARINNQMVTTSLLRDIAPFLIDIHGQHDNQSLLNSSKHIDFLDSYSNISNEKKEYSDIFKKLKEINNELLSLNKNEQERLSKIDLLKYQIDELKKADLKPSEEEDLKNEQNIIQNSEKLSKNIMSSYSYLYDGDKNVCDNLSYAVSDLSQIADFDNSLVSLLERLKESMYNIEDISHELYDYASRTEFDQERLDQICMRLDLIKKLQRKYGATNQLCIDFLNNAKKEYDLLINHDEKTEALTNQMNKLKKELFIKASIITKIRTDAAKKLSEEITKQLWELDMPKAKFEVKITTSDEPLPTGMDIVEFMITANVGQPPAPLSKIASGGELSRVMLGLKTVFSKDIGADTLIFDEIDTGVSGSAAQQIAKKLSELSKHKQVICISHQPQLAAAANQNYRLEKTCDNNITNTTITLLDDEQRAYELARIIDGKNITNASIEHAKEMLERGF